MEFITVLKTNQLDTIGWDKATNNCGGVDDGGVRCKNVRMFWLKESIWGQELLPHWACLMPVSRTFNSITHAKSEIELNFQKLLGIEKVTTDTRFIIIIIIAAAL